jgi:hypothetical protein
MNKYATGFPLLSLTGKGEPSASSAMIAAILAEYGALHVDIDIATRSTDGVEAVACRRSG